MHEWAQQREWVKGNTQQCVCVFTSCVAFNCKRTCSHNKTFVRLNEVEMSCDVMKEFLFYSFLFYNVRLFWGSQSSVFYYLCETPAQIRGGQGRVVAWKLRLAPLWAGAVAEPLIVHCCNYHPSCRLKTICYTFYFTVQTESCHSLIYGQFPMYYYHHGRIPGWLWLWPLQLAIRGLKLILP